jgi:hypothetical protein
MIRRLLWRACFERVALRRDCPQYARGAVGEDIVLASRRPAWLAATVRRPNWSRGRPYVRALPINLDWDPYGVSAAAEDALPLPSSTMVLAERCHRHEYAHDQPDRYADNEHEYCVHLALAHARHPALVPLRRVIPRGAPFPSTVTLAAERHRLSIDGHAFGHPIRDCSLGHINNHHDSDRD